MRRLIALAMSLGLLAGCQQMLDSSRLETEPRDIGATCQSNAGTYFLPRRLITITVTNPTAAGGGYGIQVLPPENQVYVADRSEVYCLDFLLSAFSDDRVGIQRNERGLLQRVYTRAEDKT